MSNDLLNRTDNMFTTGYSNEDVKSDFDKRDVAARIYFKSDDNKNILCTTHNYNINTYPTIPIAAYNGDGIYTICAAYKVNDFCKTVSIESFMEIRSALDKNTVMPNGDLRLQKSNIFKTTYDLNTDVSASRIKYIKINGQNVPSNVNQITVANDVKFDKNTSKLIFVEIAYDRKKTDMNCKIHATVGADVHNEYGIELQDYQGGSAEFHYVNDMQYRKQQHLTVNQKLPERCAGEKYININGDWILSHKPFYKLKNINDLGNFVTPKAMFVFDESTHLISDKISTVSISDKEDYNDDVPILQTNRVVSKTPIMPYDNTVFNNDFADKNTFINKTVIKLKDGSKYCDMPGYVYWDNDIDKPNNINREFDNDAKSTIGFGNHYLTYAYEMKDGKPVKLLTRKHYYVTYRALPTQLTVQYQGLDGKLMDAQPYAILQDGKAIQSWKSYWLSSDKKIEHRSYEDMYNFVKDKRYDIADYQVYDYNGDAYLMPGDYTIAPAIKAPDGYEWVTEKIDNAGNMRQTIKTGEGTDHVHIDVLGNKNVDKNVCQYGVRFVLRKIGDKALNNVVTLSELPQKPVESVLNEIISGNYNNPSTNFENPDFKIDPNISGKVDSKIVFNKSFDDKSKEFTYDIISNTSMEQSANPYPDVFTDNEWQDFVKSSSDNKNNSNAISKTFYSLNKNKQFAVLQKPDDNYYYDAVKGYYATYFVYSWNPENAHNDLIEKQHHQSHTDHGYPIKGGPLAPAEQYDSYLNNLDSFQLFNKELFDGKHNMNISVKSTNLKHGNILIYGKAIYHISNNNKYTLHIPVSIESDIYKDVHDSYITETPFKATTKAIYHFVDDFQYRHAQNVDNKSQLKRRGANEIGISDNDVINYTSGDFSNHKYYDLSETPYHAINDCKDIDSVIAVNTFGTREVHNLNYAYSTEPNSPNPSGVYWDDKNKQCTDPAEPSLNQLTYKNIPGYVYIDNDIDKPIVYKYSKDDTVFDPSFKYKKDRFYVGFAPLHWTDSFEDGYGNNIMPCDYLLVPFEKCDDKGNVIETLSTKHYYVTFRKIPTRLIVQYKDPNGNLIDGKRYNLLQDNKALLTAKNPVLTTSHWDGYYDDFDNLKTFVQSKAYDVFGKNNVYYKDGQAYLTDGDYQIQAGIDAPEGYEWVPEVKGGDKFHIDLVKSAKDPTVKVVTMVLRKKKETAPHINMVVVTPTPKPVPPTPAPVTPVPELVNPAPQPVTPVMPVTPVPQPVTPENHDVMPVVPPVVTPVVTVPETTVPSTVQEHANDIPVVESPDLAKLVNNTDTQKPEAHSAKADPVVSGQPAKHLSQQLPKTGAGIVTMLALGLQTMVAGVAMKFRKRR